MSFYKTLKKILIRIIPKSQLFKYELYFRKLYSITYLGSKYQCNICNARLRVFVNTHNNKICPKCGSLQRTRRLWSIVDSFKLTNKNKILHFSPSRSIYRKFKSLKLNYISTDLSGDFIADINYNITNINVEDNHFDLVICYHVLEHVEEDIKAMKELKRILKKNGTCIIQTPYKEGDIYEDFSIITPTEREKHFGQSDHVRIYSVEGLKKRLESVGFIVSTKVFHDVKDNYHGFSQNETVLFANNPN